MIITSNAVVMSLELDFTWAGWIWVENFYLIVYGFELLVKLRSTGCAAYFLDTAHIFFNYLDVLMVLGGMMDLWFPPLMSVVKAAAGIDDGGSDLAAQFSNIIIILRIMRILRVLRLVKLMKVVTPLYRLLVGVMDSFRAMQWVMIL